MITRKNAVIIRALCPQKLQSLGVASSWTLQYRRGGTFRGSHVSHVEAYWRQMSFRAKDRRTAHFAQIGLAQGQRGCPTLKERLSFVQPLNLGALGILAESRHLSFVSQPATMLCNFHRMTGGYDSHACIACILERLGHDPS